MSSLLGNRSKGLVWIVSAPGGTGKTTLVHMLVKEFPEIVVNISYTTREPRVGEVNGVDYHFISEATFKQKIDDNDFFEYVQLYGAYYGTCKRRIEQQQEQGKHVVLVIDVQGKRRLQEQTQSISIFIEPPSLKVLRERLIHRKTETEEQISERLEWAKIELEAAASYDYRMINDDLSTAYRVLKSIVVAECHRTVNYTRRVE